MTVQQVLQSLPRIHNDIHSTRRLKNRPEQSPKRVLSPRSLAFESLLNLIQRPTLGLMHESGTNQRSQHRATTEQEISPKGALRQKDRSRQSHQEIGQPVRRMAQRSSRRASPVGMDLRHVDLNANRPCHGVNNCEDVYRDNNHPAASSKRPVDCVPGV